MLGWLIALLLLALLPSVLAVCPAAPLPAVVTAGIVVVVPPCLSMPADFDVATRFARDTARTGRAEGENRNRRAERAGCADGEPVTPAGVATVVPDVRAVAIVEPAGVSPLTVAHVP